MLPHADKTRETCSYATRVTIVRHTHDIDIVGIEVNAAVGPFDILMQLVRRVGDEAVLLLDTEGLDEDVDHGLGAIQELVLYIKPSDLKWLEFR